MLGEGALDVVLQCFSSQRNSVCKRNMLATSGVVMHGRKHSYIRM